MQVVNMSAYIQSQISTISSQSGFYNGHMVSINLDGIRCLWTGKTFEYDRMVWPSREVYQDWKWVTAKMFVDEWVRVQAALIHTVVCSSRWKK